LLNKVLSSIGWKGTGLGLAGGSLLTALKLEAIGKTAVIPALYNQIRHGNNYEKWDPFTRYAMGIKKDEELGGYINTNSGWLTNGIMTSVINKPIEQGLRLIPVFKEKAEEKENNVESIAESRHYRTTGWLDEAKAGEQVDNAFIIADKDIKSKLNNNTNMWEDVKGYFMVQGNDGQWQYVKGTLNTPNQGTSSSDNLKKVTFSWVDNNGNMQSLSGDKIREHIVSGQIRTFSENDREAVYRDMYYEILSPEDRDDVVIDTKGGLFNGYDTEESRAQYEQWQANNKSQEKKREGLDEMARRIAREFIKEIQLERENDRQ